jgi:hypothetical protein
MCVKYEELLPLGPEVMLLLLLLLSLFCCYIVHLLLRLSSRKRTRLASASSRVRPEMTAAGGAAGTWPGARRGWRTCAKPSLILRLVSGQGTTWGIMMAAWVWGMETTWGGRIWDPVQQRSSRWQLPCMHMQLHSIRVAWVIMQVA